MKRRSFITKTLALLVVLPFASKSADAFEPSPVKVHYPAHGYFAAGAKDWPTDLRAFQVYITRNGVPCSYSHAYDHKEGVITFTDAN